MRRTLLATLFGAWLLAVSIGPALADSPSPSPGAYGGDTRTAGQGPGLVGSPLYAIGGVLLVALISIALTLAYLRLSPAGAAGPRPPAADADGSEPLE